MQHQQQHGGIEQVIGDLQQPYPQTDQRNVEEQEHHVADPEADDEPPEQVGLVVDQVGPRGDAVDQHSAEQQCHDGVTGYAEAERRYEGGLHRGVVGRFRSRDTLYRPLVPNPRIRIARQLLLERGQ